MLRQRRGRGKQGGGMRHIDLDGIGVFALTDCVPAPAPCAYSFPDAGARELPERWFAGAQFHTRFGPFLLRMGDADILVDCGVGPGPIAYFPGLDGALPAALAAVGSSLARIGTVIFTHLHLDHVGWAPFLPNARFFVPAREWAHWSTVSPPPGLPHHVDAVARCVAPLAESGTLLRVEASGACVPGVELLAAPGHTPGHHAVLVRSRLLIAGDTWHNPAQIAFPSLCHRADMDKPAAIVSRTRLAQAAYDNGWMVAAGHFTEENVFGHIGKSGERLSFMP
jgi:glyoxylase-like metal-dependent hydrolase (beta-lactamase superfamily II)